MLTLRLNWLLSPSQIFSNSRGKFDLLARSTLLQEGLDFAHAPGGLTTTKNYFHQHVVQVHKLANMQSKPSSTWSQAVYILDKWHCLHINRCRTCHMTSWITSTSRSRRQRRGPWIMVRLRNQKTSYKPYRWKYTRTFSGPDSVLICLDGSHWWWWWRWHQQVWFQNLLIEDRLESESQRTHEAHRIQPIQLVLVPPVLLLSSEQTV